MSTTGPLAGIKVLEIQSIGPGPFAAMLLADLGATVLRVGRRQKGIGGMTNPVLDRGRCGQVVLDLKSAEGKAKLLDLVGRSDALIEGYRPGVMERLGLGPEVCLERRPSLVYGRMTGWGRRGPLAHTAGHDINYIALSGALHACGSAESGPWPPLNLVGDFGGGGLLLAFGMVSALLESRTSGQGQIVDTAMIDGAGLLMAMLYGFRTMGLWPAERAGNILDGSAYYYTCYVCADGRWMAVGAIEPEFRLVLFEKLGLAAEAKTLMNARHDDPAIRARFAGIFVGRTRDEWQTVFDGSDACVSPVLAMSEVNTHPHNRDWGTFSVVDGQVQPAPAPRFSRTPPPPPHPVGAGAFGHADWGLTAGELAPV